ncbi:hypothetical protein Poli38472_002047 [Pythium oligandrum]|uniref:Acyl-coenzyme A oxidase n=1 Tax=Pythium oligandrum TaxID=41045 RepID=A0A8K1FHU9_PYTOL|nr:hypothetical protein Poli38472_002047 [Pythium oligandrum]|eukprot:TMW63106.1 hypothetical protein Poli38472_002047 [Pythium oligandrum]
MAHTGENPLDVERRQSALPARELTYVLWKSKEHAELRERLEALLVKDPAFDNKKMDYLSRNEAYARALRMAGKVEIIARQNRLNEYETEQLRLVFQAFTSCSSPTTLHTLMFIKNLALLFTEEQQQKWVQLAKDCRMVGCYAQTELGHGSNVRGLETTATFIPETDEFEIHSPTLSSIKWWPGALGRTANFGVVYARMIIHGKDYGVHNFMVQLREFDTHETRPGVMCGDIGAKVGFNNVDNGYCKFDRVRIPRENMGMRFSTVDRNGKYSKNRSVPHEVLYFTMLQTRMGFVLSSGLSLGKAVTISVRYSAVRAQGYDAKDESKELKVIDYQSQQYRLLPLVAASYAITLTGNQMDAFTEVLSKQIDSGDVSKLDIAHAMSCGLKVVSTDAAAAGMEICRRACGGHGYLLASGIPTLLNDMVQMVTAEGENFVLSLQTARTLLKGLKAFRSGVKLPKEMAFLANIDKSFPPQTRTKSNWLEPQHYVSAFQQRFLYLLRDLEQRVSRASSVPVGVQENSVLCYKLTMAYGKLLLVSNFASAIASPATFSKLPLSTPRILEVVRLLSHLFALTQLDADAGEFMACGAILPSDLAVIRATIEELLPLIRPHAVVLVDAFNFSDHALNSALGRYDGNVYQALYDSAQQDDVNQSSDKIALHEFLLPIRNALQSRL